MGEPIVTSINIQDIPYKIKGTLYDEFGENTDGGVTQKVISDYINDNLYVHYKSPELSYNTLVSLPHAIEQNNEYRIKISYIGPYKKTGDEDAVIGDISLYNIQSDSTYKLELFHGSTTDREFVFDIKKEDWQGITTDKFFLRTYISATTFVTDESNKVVIDIVDMSSTVGNTLHSNIESNNLSNSLKKSIGGLGTLFVGIGTTNQSVYDIYKECYSEVYCPITKANDYLYFTKYSNGEIFLRVGKLNGASLAGNSIVFRTNFGSGDVGKIITIYSNGNYPNINVSYGDIVAYVLITSEQILSVTDEQSGCILSDDIFSIEHWSKINQYVNGVVPSESINYTMLSSDLQTKLDTIEVIGGGIVFSARGVASLDAYAKYLTIYSEVYFCGPKLDGYYYSTKIYSNNIYFRIRLISDDSQLLIEHISIASATANSIIEIKSTKVYPELGFGIDDTIAYVVFSSTDELGTINDGSYGALLSDDIFNIKKWSLIYNTIGKNDDVDIDDNSITLDKLSDNASMEKNMYLNLPDEITAIKGKELRIYHRSVIAAINPYNYSIEVVCGIGKNYPRYYSVVPDDVGTYELTYYVRNNQDATIITKSTSLKVVAQLAEGSTHNANILCVGASVVESGWMQAELKRMLTTNSQNTPYNVTENIPLGENQYYTLTTAISAVPLTLKRLGFILVFQSNASTWNTKKFNANDISQWSDETKWINCSTPVQIGAFYPKGLNLNGINFVGRKLASRTFQEEYVLNNEDIINSVAEIDVNYEATGGWTWSNYINGRSGLRFTLSTMPSVQINSTFTIDNVTGVTFTLMEINGNEISGTYSGTLSGTIPQTGILRKSNNSSITLSYTSATVESYSPFSDGTSVNRISSYANQYCQGNIDIVIFQLGVNDAFGNVISIDSIKTLIQGFHSTFPNIKVLLTSPMLPDPRGGMGASYGANNTYYWNMIARRFKILYDALESVSKDSEFNSYVSFVHACIMCDIEHAYQYEDAKVSIRSFEKETRGKNGVHPSYIGCCELADSIFAKLNEILA